MRSLASDRSDTRRKSGNKQWNAHIDSDRLTERRAEWIFEVTNSFFLAKTYYQQFFSCCWNAKTYYQMVCGFFKYIESKRSSRVRNLHLFETQCTGDIHINSSRASIAPWSLSPFLSVIHGHAIAVAAQWIIALLKNISFWSLIRLNRAINHRHSNVFELETKKTASASIVRFGCNSSAAAVVPIQRNEQTNRQIMMIYLIAPKNLNSNPKHISFRWFLVRIWRHSDSPMPFRWETIN